MWAAAWAAAKAKPTQELLAPAARNIVRRVPGTEHWDFNDKNWPKEKLKPDAAAHVAV